MFRKNALILVLISAALVLLLLMWVHAYNDPAISVNMQWSRSDPRAFVTPNDPAVQATASAAAYGKVNPVEEDARVALAFNERKAAAFKSTEHFVGYFVNRVLGAEMRKSAAGESPGARLSHRLRQAAPRRR